MQRVLLKSVLVGFGLVGWMALNASGALADEFSVAIVISPMGTEVVSGEFMEGFQLAVDQSPDVSHPPDTEGGDHLGSMDVAFVVIDDRTGSAEYADAVAELEGIPIVVIDADAEIVSAILLSLDDAQPFVIVTRDTTGSGLSLPSPEVVATYHKDVDVLLTDRATSFADAYEEAHGRIPSAAATRGYVAARMIDIGVESTDRDPFDTQALASGITDVVGESKITEPAVAPVVSSPDRDVAAASSERNVNTFPALVAVVLLVVVGGIVLAFRIRRRSTG